MSLQSDIELILKNNGPTCSGNIINALVAKGVSYDASRKAVSRTKFPIQKLKGISFQANQKFVYLLTHRNSEVFKEALTFELVENKTAAGKALEGIKANCGIINSNHFSIISGAPISNTKKQLRFDVVLEQLKDNGLIYETKIDGQIYLYPYDTTVSPLKAELYTKLNENILTSIKKWIISLGLGSKDTVRVKTKNDLNPQFGYFDWDVTSPSYLNIFKTAKKANGHFVADLKLNEGKFVTAKQLESFFNKVDVCNFRMKQKSFQPAIIHMGLDEEALYESRRRGIMLIELKHLVDSNLVAYMKQIYEIFSRIDKLAESADSIKSLIQTITKTEVGRLLNLPGPLFQMIYAYLLKLDGNTYIKLGELVNSELGNTEIDIYVQRNHSDVIFIECKAYKKDKKFPFDEFEAWIHTKRERIRKWYTKVKPSSVKSFSYQFVVANEITPEERIKINEITARFSVKPITVLDYNEIRKIAIDRNEKEIVSILEAHFG